MRAHAGCFAFAVVVGFAGCSSSEPNEPASKPKPAASATPAPAPAAEPEPAGGIVIKGSKHKDDDARPKTDDEAEARRQAKIEELKRKAAESNATPGWVDFSSDECKFQALFPRKPDTRDEPVPLRTGEKLTMKAFFVLQETPQSPDYRLFRIGVIDFPSQIPEKEVSTFLSGFVSGIVGAFAGRNAEVLESRTIDLGGSPGRSVVARGANGVSAKLRVYLADRKRLYALSTAAKTSEIDSRDVTRFLESFRLKP